MGVSWCCLPQMEIRAPIFNMRGSHRSKNLYICARPSKHSCEVKCFSTNLIQRDSRVHPCGHPALHLQSMMMIYVGLQLQPPGRFLTIQFQGLGFPSLPFTWIDMFQYTLTHHVWVADLLSILSNHIATFLSIPWSVFQVSMRLKSLRITSPISKHVQCNHWKIKLNARQTAHAFGIQSVFACNFFSSFDTLNYGGT